MEGTSVRPNPCSLFNQFRPTLDAHLEIRETAEMVLMKNPSSSYFINEQNEDITINENLFPLTPEYPERYCVRKGLLYRDFKGTTSWRGRTPQSANCLYGISGEDLRQSS